MGENGLHLPQVVGTPTGLIHTKARNSASAEVMQHRVDIVAANWNVFPCCSALPQPRMMHETGCITQ